MEEEEERSISITKRPLAIDFNELLGNDDFDPPEVLRVKKPKPEENPPPVPAAMDGDDELDKLRNDVLEDMIRRQRSLMKKLAAKLPDNGQKIRVRLKDLEDEQQRRIENPERYIRKVEKPFGGTSSAGVCNSFREEIASPPTTESFFKLFSWKLDDDFIKRRESSKGNAFDRELSSLGHCNRQNKDTYGSFVPKGAQKTRSASRQTPFRSLSNFYSNKGKAFLSSGDRKNNSGHLSEERSSSSFAKRDDRYQLRNRTRKSETIFLVDEEEPESTDTTEQIEEIPESMKDSRVYYPLRDDPDSVEICYTDTKCLDPQGYLTSAIMNFYIRQWFQPQEASRLRNKIRKLLKEEFQKASDSNRSKEPSPRSDASEERTDTLKPF